MRWKPDTCDCQFLMEDNPMPDGRWLCLAVEAACEIHGKMGSHQQVLDECMELNRAWNSTQPPPKEE